MESEHTIASISELNNTGAIALAHGKVKLAFTSFSDAIELMLVLCHNFSDEQISDSCGRFGGLSMEAALEKAKSAYTHFDHLTTTRFNHQHFVYQDALIFNPTLVLSPHASRTHLPICFSMLLFNLGLTYHTVAKNVGEKALMQAIFWYDTCLAQLHAAVPGTKSGSMKILLAAMNNLAISSYDLSHFPKVRHIFTILMEIVSSYSTDERPQNFPAAEMEGLLLNIILLHAVSIAPAA